MNRPIEKFIENTESIVDGDYGDFMRKENLYFLQMMEELGSLMSHETKKKLFEMQNYIQFSPSWDIEQTRRQVIQDAQIIDHMLVNRPSEMVQTNSALEFVPIGHPAPI